MTTLHRSLLIALVALALAATIAFAIVGLSYTPRVNASAPIGLPAQVATSSTLAVGPSNNMFAFGTTTRESAYMCAARVITTDFNPIRVSFASLSSTTLSTSVGFYQAASTTVAYDGGLFGCGYVTVRGLTGSTTIQLMETR